MLNWFLIDTSVTHSNISREYANMLGLKLSNMNGIIVIDTPASGSITTTFVCSRCPLTIYGKSFVMDLVCLPLHQIDVILGINWLEFLLNTFLGDRVCVPDVPELKKSIIEEGHRSGLSIHPGATKMYQDLKKVFLVACYEEGNC